MKACPLPTLLCAFALFLGWGLCPVSAQFLGIGRPKMRSAAEMIRRQEGPKIYKENEALVTPENSRIYVSLTRQRAFVLAGDTVYIDTPISSGKAVGMTPTGNFNVMEKDPNHRSNIYGEFQDRGGRTVRSGVSMKVDSAPSGTHYVGASMKWFMRLTDKGVGMHVGILPGYPASHGCVRLPVDIAPLIYQKVQVGTPVTIEN